MKPPRLLACALAAVLLSVATPARAAAPGPAAGRLGINLAGPADWSTEYAFVNVFRLSRAWISQRKGRSWGKGPALDLDAHGWVKRLEPDCWAETPVLTNNGGHAPSGDYVCLYEGEGTIDFNLNGRIVSREPGRIVVNLDTSKGGTFLALRATNPQNPVRNIRLILPGLEAAARTADPFLPAFLERWRGFQAIRFMDWMRTNGSTQRDWADRPTPEDATYTRAGVPVEVMVDLCNRLGAAPWFCMPHEATDDYVRRFAQLVRERLDPKLKIYVEYSNEVWNGIFEQHRYAERRAKELQLGPPERPWEGAALFHGRRSREVFRIWEEVFGGPARLVRVVAWQAASGAYWTDGMLLGRDGTAAAADALAIAPYVTMCIGPKTTPDTATVAGWTVDHVLDHAETQALSKSVEWIRTQKAVADKYGLQLLAYEAGQHLVGVGGGENNEAMTKLFQAANRHPRMGAIYTKYLDAWRDAGGGLMCIFSSTGTWGKWGSWGLAEYLDESESAQPKLHAVLEWNRARAVR